MAAASLGVPDLGTSTLDDVLIDARRITDVCDVPLLVDVDTGFGPSAFNIARSTRSLIKAGAAGLHIEDLAQYTRFAEALRVPILANITEFGMTPLWTVDELRAAGVRLPCTHCRRSAP